MRLLIVSLLAWLIASTSTAEQPREVGMVTGSPTGTYYRFGQDVQSVLQSKTIKLSVKESSGSIDNINRIDSPENAALGIVQSDVLGFLRRSDSEESRKISENLRMIYPLFDEEVHVIARSNIKNFSDLNGKRVAVGPHGSGSWLTALNLFKITGVEPAKTMRSSPEEGMLDVLKGKADALIVVAGKPVKLFENLESLKDYQEYSDILKTIHFVPIEHPMVLAEYTPAEITSEDYSFVKRPVRTAAVTAVLITFDFATSATKYAEKRCDAIGQISNAIHDNIDELRRSGHPKWQEVDLDAELAVWKKDDCSVTAKSSSVLETDLFEVLAK